MTLSVSCEVDTSKLFLYIVEREVLGKTLAEDICTPNPDCDTDTSAMTGSMNCFEVSKLFEITIDTNRSVRTALLFECRLPVANSDLSSLHSHVCCMLSATDVMLPIVCVPIST